METFFKDKKINITLFILLAVLSIFVIAKLINEIKSSYYIGRGNQPANTISVEGSGEVTAISDIATIGLNISKEGKTSKEAQDLLNEQVAKTLEYLKSKNIEEKDIKSEYGGLSPKYSYESQVCYTYNCPSKDPKIVGYTATQSINIKVREVDTANDIRTGLTGLGLTDISGPTFGMDDEEVYKDQARSEAIKEAREKAQVLAKELGVRLGKVVSFYENNGTNYPMYDAKMMTAGAEMLSSKQAPVLPKGENKIISNITVIYEIK